MFVVKFIARIILNGLALYAAKTYLPGFHLGGGLDTLIVGGILLALLNTFVRPILNLISAPLRWITFGLFGLVINIAIIWIASQLLTKLAIANITTLFWASIIIAIANAFF